MDDKKRGVSLPSYIQGCQAHSPARCGMRGCVSPHTHTHTHTHTHARMRKHTHTHTHTHPTHSRITQQKYKLDRFQCYYGRTWHNALKRRILLDNDLYGHTVLDEEPASSSRWAPAGMAFWSGNQREASAGKLHLSCPYLLSETTRSSNKRRRAHPAHFIFLLASSHRGRLVCCSRSRSR
jgi:hypothetical protein